MNSEQIMKYRVIIRPEAENDLKEAFTWYEDKRQGLGYDFLLQVDAGLRFIERNPEIFPKGYKGTKKYIIKRFPYKIIYIIKKQKIIILGIIHGKKSANFVNKRIEGI